MSTASIRLLAVVLAVAVGVAACDDSGSTDSTGTSGPSISTSAPESTADMPQRELLSYGFEVGDVYSYDVALEQHILLESEGADEAIGDQGVPASADVIVTAAGRFAYEVSAGPDTESYSVAIEGSFSDVAIEGTADGEQVADASDIEQLGVIEPVSTVVVVDSLGRLTQDPTSPTGVLGLGATPLTGLSGDLGRMVGPVLSPEPVTVGDTWTETYTETNLGDEPVETTLTATLTGTETVDGAETLVIDTESRTGQADIDLAEFFAGFMGAFADPEDPEADFEAMADQLVFRITIAPSSTEGTTWFRPESGLALRSTTTGPPTAFQMEVALPDEDTGELETYEMRLEVAQTIDYTLVSD